MDTHQIYQIEDLLSALIWAIVIIMFSYIIALFNKKDKPHYRWFVPVVIFKIFMGLFFGYTYIKILGYGGDTVAYWESAVKLNNLFFESPMAYFQELWGTPSRETMLNNFNSNTGYPPSWIYYEPESFFVAKIVSLFTFITFNSFNAITIILAFISASASFKLFELVRSFNFTKENIVAFAILFFPTVAFWCSGISKDTVILIVLYLLVVQVFYLVLGFDGNKIKRILLILFFTLIAFKIRSFMIVAIVLPFIIAMGFTQINKIKNDFLNIFSKLTLLVIVAVVMVYTLSTSALPFGFGEDYLEEVAVIQKDFTSNVTYGGPKYDLNIDDFTPLGMIKSGPLSIFTAFYRPFIWEARGQGALLLMSGLESLILIFLTILFFIKGSLRQKLKFIGNNKFLLFSILFAVIFGFFVGFTAGLFNVLVRFKAPLMVFFVLVLLVDINWIKKGMISDDSIDK